MNDNSSVLVWIDLDSSVGIVAILHAAAFLSVALRGRGVVEESSRKKFRQFLLTPLFTNLPTHSEVIRGEFL